MEQELQKQVDGAMNFGMMDSSQQMHNPAPPRSEISFNLSEANYQTEGQFNSQTQREREEIIYQQNEAEKELMNMGLNQIQPHDENTRRIESKDSMWKPAPIIGNTQQHQAPSMT